MNFIENQWIEGEGREFTSMNPADQTVIRRGHHSSLEEIDRALTISRKACAEWSFTPLSERMTFLDLYRDRLKNRREELATIISQEVGKPLWESLREVDSMIHKCDITKQGYALRSHDIIIDDPERIVRARHKPHGILAVFGAFNFPGHLPHGHIAPAILAGNCVLFKPSEKTASVGAFLTQLWEECNLPKGVFQLLQGGVEVAKAIANHPQIDGLLFTGSYNVGEKLRQSFATKGGKILALEMGGNNAMIISKSDSKAASYATFLSSYITTGQRCTCTRRLIIVEPKVGSSFLEELISWIDRAIIGRYDATPEPFMGPIIDEAARDHFLKKEAELISKGGIALRRSHNRPGSLFVSPSLIDVTQISSLEDEELFGPLLQLYRASTLEEAVKIANATSYGLAAALFSDEEEEFRYFWEHIRAGVVNLNEPTIGASSHLPFGGVGRSGNFRPSALYAADYCCYPVATIERRQAELPSKLNPGIAEKRS